jgi:hypothetical protein
VVAVRAAVGREESRVPEHRRGAAGPGEAVGWAALLPDLTDVDLRTLRVMDDPGLTAAVTEVLGRPGVFREVWCAGEDGLEGVDGPGERLFPVEVTSLVPPEDPRE